MEEITVALAGNPNVGKSTLFNALTGLRQHTGNWPGKTVERAEGQYTFGGRLFRLVDLPGTYSLLADSPEEAVTRDFLRSGAEVTVVVADATALCRSLALAMQIRLRTQRMVVCVNLMDEAKKKGLDVDLVRLEQRMGVPVCGISAAREQGLDELRSCIAGAVERPPCDEWLLRLDVSVERALSRLCTQMDRRAALALLLGETLPENEEQHRALGRAQVILDESGLVGGALERSVTVSLMRRAEEIGRECLSGGQEPSVVWIDRWLTGRITGPVLFLAGLAFLFYLTLRLAAWPSQLLFQLLPKLEAPLGLLLAGLRAPLWLQQLLVEGAYHTAAWVAAVMLPPMAIFFPLFTLLEDVGLLPRVAFCLDRLFAAAGAHGRQSLTMCMALGCNVCGVTGCRIIDSPRERLIAMVTNSFVPCNGRLPALLTLSMLFFGGGGYVSATAMFMGILLLSLAATWLCARCLSRTVLQGEASSFSLELPPYRRPRIGRVLVRSLLDRTIFVLGRAMAVAGPAGVVLWLATHLLWREQTLLAVAAAALEGAGRLLGLDGMILLAFFLSFPAGELLLPVLLMGYLASGELVAYESAVQLGEILCANGWNMVTALCTMVLVVFHLPCGTTCLTIARESGSARWTALAMALPAVVGVSLCLLIRGAAALLGG